MSTPVSAAPSTPNAAPTTTESKVSDNKAPVSQGNSAPKAEAKQPEGEAIVKKAMGEATSEKKPESTPETSEKKPTETQAEKEIRKLKMKVNGKEREYTEDEVIRRAQMFESAEEKFQEAAKRTKQMEQFIEALKTNPAAILSHPELGIDMRKLAEEYLTKEVKREMMSPEERELEELRTFKQQYEEQRQNEEKKRLTEQQQQELQALQQRQREHFDKQISEVLSKSNLPKNAYTVKKVAELLHSAVSKGYELDVQLAVDMVKESYLTDIQSLVGSLDGEHLLSMLGGDIAKKIRQYDLNRLKAKMQPQQPAEILEQQQKTSQPRQNRGENKFMSQSEWAEMIRKKAGI